jgi:hypothetical protein
MKVGEYYLVIKSHFWPMSKFRPPPVRENAPTGDMLPVHGGHARAMPPPHWTRVQSPCANVEMPEHSPLTSHSSLHSHSILASPAARERIAQSTSAMGTELEACYHLLPATAPFLHPRQEFHHHLQHAPHLPALCFDRPRRRTVPPPQRPPSLVSVVVASLQWVVTSLAKPCRRVMQASSCSTAATHHRRCRRPSGVGRSPALLCSVL